MVRTVSVATSAGKSQLLYQRLDDGFLHERCPAKRPGSRISKVRATNPVPTTVTMVYCRSAILLRGPASQTAGGEKGANLCREGIHTGACKSEGFSSQEPVIVTQRKASYGRASSRSPQPTVIVRLWSGNQTTRNAAHDWLAFAPGIHQLQPSRRSIPFRFFRQEGTFAGAQPAFWPGPIPKCPDR